MLHIYIFGAMIYWLMYCFMFLCARCQGPAGMEAADAGWDTGLGAAGGGAHKVSGVCTPAVGPTRKARARGPGPAGLETAGIG